MENAIWILWLILGVILVVAEVFTLGFVLLWFGVGALAAALLGYLGFGLGSQFAAFAVVSVALTAMSRTIFANYFTHGDGNRLKMGVDSMPGQIGTVTTASSGSMLEAAVKVFGSTWTAFPVDGESVLVQGEKVEIVEVKGSSVFVRKMTNELPEWRRES
ncbi:MAG TPA: NfeD family protein [Pyrinomonadaceae bacterium]|nr:NfeD family protein [Chloracidobacterium sp.]MBP9934753.1 NfeD family protein [Pyrinomonadaceae bacterium]MBK7803217.1 NfeD family protein [Chloracidobacterium sp.]MBK9438139.1 NfeD family protein [Chloracidobacterium sp.]MBK9767538.1 NfeD family protein [Chloracidobacterium sp.]